MKQYVRRRNSLRAKLVELEVDAMLVTNVVNVRYLTGFTGDSTYLLVGHDGDLLLSDPRYEVQISEECGVESKPGVESTLVAGTRTALGGKLDVFIRKPSELLLPVTAKQLGKRKLARVLVESHTMSVADHRQLCELCPDIELRLGAGEVEDLRVIKDDGEIETLRRAVEVAQRVFSSVRAQLSSEQTERQIAHELERQIRGLGGSGCSFAPIVAVGPRAALPHATPGESRIGDAPFVLIDWGATVEGYRSDLTRVLLTSKIPAKFVKIYEAVWAAQRAAIDALRPGVMVSEVDAIAREVIADAGMAKRFNHGLGHGIGLDIHESPRLGKNQDRPLEPGMVVTVEPGVYYPGFGGVRIEDDVLITASGHEVLSSLPGDMESNRVDLLN